MVAQAIIFGTALLEDSMTSGTRDFEGIQIPTPGEFSIDPNHTRVSFTVRHLMVSKVRGGFTGTKGAITIAENPLESSVEIEIDAATIDTGVTDRDNHLRSPDFLDVEKWPTLTFRSTEVLAPKDNEFRLLGDLTIRDVTRPVELDVEFEGHIVSPYGHEVIGFSATTEINRDEFGITWNQAIEAGGVVVGPRVKIEISAEGVRK
jgi:polyisoprenoid-binding protein YceI